jgi:hypothetical protein
VSDWIDELTPDEREHWDEFVDHFRRDALTKIAGSAAFVSLVPSEADVDVKFAVELGTAVMLDKPIIAVTMPGARVPAKLAAVADEIVIADIDTEAGRVTTGDAISRFLASLPAEAGS